MKKEVRTSKVSPKIFGEYLRIISDELSLRMNQSQGNYITRLNDAEHILRIVQRLIDVTESSTVLRCIGNMGHLTKDENAYESVGAHTNFARAIMKEYLIFAYGWGKDPPNYSRDIIDLALQTHDLPENATGDKPDNDEDKRAAKETFEREYYQDYMSLYSEEELSDNDVKLVLKLLNGMHTLGLPEERGCYLSDKTAAFLHALMLDKKGSMPYAYPRDPQITDINREEMKMCKPRYKGGYLLSEIWTNDFLFARELNRYDDTGFFTAITVMTTLFCHNCKWYDWRKDQYLP